MAKSNSNFKKWLETVTSQFKGLRTSNKKKSRSSQISKKTRDKSKILTSKLKSDQSRWINSMMRNHSRNTKSMRPRKSIALSPLKMSSLINTLRINPS